MAFLRTLPEHFPLFTVIVGLFAALLCLFFRERGARICAIAAQGVSALLGGGAFLYLAVTGKDHVLYRLGPAGASLAAINQLRFSKLETLLAAAFSLVILLSVAGGYRYVKEDIDKSKINLYYILICLLGSASSALVYTNDLFSGYVFVEILTLTSCGILMIRELGRTTVAAVRYMIVNLLGSGLLLLGTALLYGTTGNLLMEEIRRVLETPGVPALPVYTAAALIVCGLAIKSGMFPFYFWMPDTYGFSTPTSASILSGVVTKGYILLLMKVLCRTLGTDREVTQRLGPVLLAAGVCGMVFGSVSAIRQKTLQKMLAFSSAAQIGYIYVGIGIGCLFGTEDAAAFGFAAAVYHILTHAFTKPLLFLAAARLSEASDGMSSFSRLRGAAARARLAAIAFTAAALSMVGVPLFAGFSSKVLFAVASIRSGSVPLFIAVLTALAVSTVLNTLYFLRAVIVLYSAGAPAAPAEAAKDENAASALPAQAARESAPAPAALNEGSADAGSPATALNEGANAETAPTALNEAADAETAPAALNEAADAGFPANAQNEPAGSGKQRTRTLRSEKSLAFASLIFLVLNVALGTGAAAVSRVLLEVFSGASFS